jgi:transcriptional regulator with XRE-family HTH domain
MATQIRSFGERLRDWRQRRRLSQLDLALEAEMSARHLSFLETGRARPSRDMLLRLAQSLEVPLRERNALLLAAGFAPAYGERPLDAPEMLGAREAIERLLVAHEPSPALAVDRHWTVLASNRAVGLLLDGVAPFLLAPPLNALRLSLHPEGLAPRVLNFAAWRAHLLHRLRQQQAATGDPVLAALAAELSAYPVREGMVAEEQVLDGAVAVPLRLVTAQGVLSFISTTTVFGTPLDVALSEVALETFLPADSTTSAALASLARNGSGLGFAPQGRSPLGQRSFRSAKQLRPRPRLTD